MTHKAGSMGSESLIFCQPLPIRLTEAVCLLIAHNDKARNASCWPCRLWCWRLAYRVACASTESMTCMTNCCLVRGSWLMRLTCSCSLPKTKKPNKTEGEKQGLRYATLLRDVYRRIVVPAMRHGGRQRPMSAQSPLGTSPLTA